MALVKDLTKQIIGKRIRVAGESATVESTVTGIKFGPRDTAISLDPPIGQVGFTLHLGDEDEIEVLD